MKITYPSASIDEFCLDEIITIDSDLNCPSCGSLAAPRILSGFHEIYVGPEAAYVAHCRCQCPICNGTYTIDYTAITDEAGYTSANDIYYINPET